MSRADDLILGANYYWILGLPDAPDPVTDNAKLRELVADMAKAERAKIAGAGSTNAENGTRAALLLALKQRMLDDLGDEKSNPPTPKDTWIRFREEYRTALKADQTARQRDANIILDILGESELSRRIADKVAAEIGDADLFLEITSARRITICDEGAASDVPPGFENACNSARQKAIKLLPYLKAYGAEDVYQLLSLTTGKTLDKHSSEGDMAAAIDILQKAPNEMTGDTKTKGEPLSQIKTQLSNVFKVAQTFPLRPILDDFIRLERVMPFFAAVKLMKSVDILRRDHVERIVVKGAAAGALPPERVLLLVKALMKKDNIAIGNWGITGHFRVCAACGTTNLGTDQTCASCRSDLFIVCANCDARFDGVSTDCPTCGTSKVAGEEGRELLAYAARSIENGDIAQAERAIADAMKRVPRSQVFSGLNAKLSNLRSKAGSEEARLSELVVQKRQMVAAAEALAKTTSGFSATVRDRLRAKVDQALSVASAKTAAAQRMLDSGALVDAERTVLAALEAVVDFTPALSLLQRIPPPPPKSLSVRVAGAIAALSWSPPDITSSEIRYVVVRSESGPPRRPADAEVITITDEPSFVDRSPNCGVVLSYAVFTNRGTTHSLEAARRDNVQILAPVEELEAKSDEHSIRLSWRLPKGARDVEVRRLPPDMPVAKATAAPVLAHAQTSYVDVTASIDTEYRYYVTACYDKLGGKDRYGPAVSTLASISDPPSPISILTLDRSRGQICWQPSPRPGEDDEILLLGSGAQVPQHHSLVERTDLKVNVDSIAVTGGQGAIPLSKLPFGRHQLQVIRTRNGRTRIGPQLAVDRVTPLEDVVLTSSDIGVQVSWSWPKGCRLARLRASVDGLPPQDYFVEADGSDRTASKFISAQPPSEISVQLTALIEKSGPESDPATRQVQMVRRNELTYEIVRRAGSYLNMRKGQTILAIQFKFRERLPEFEIRFHPLYVPGPGEGDCLRVVPAGDHNIDYHEEDIGAALGKRQGFVGVILTDTGTRDRMTIVPKNQRVP